jgi:hypothetical protein
VHAAQKDPIFAKLKKLKMNLKMGETPIGLVVNYLKIKMYNLCALTN